MAIQLILYIISLSCTIPLMQIGIIHSEDEVGKTDLLFSENQSIQHYAKSGKVLWSEMSQSRKQLLHINERD